MKGTAADLISDRVVVGGPEGRLKDLAPTMRAAGAAHCVVLDQNRLLGVIHLENVAACLNAGSRILADLVTPPTPVRFTVMDQATSVAYHFRKNRLREAVIVDEAGNYVGLATSESVLDWALHRLESQEIESLQLRTRLENLTQSREEFIRAVSHELRTPLNPVVMIASDGAINTEYSPEVREQFEIIATHALHEAALIDRLLDAVNAKKGALRLEGKAVDFAKILGEAVVAMRETLPRRTLVFDARALVAPVQILGDELRLKQAFRALIECLTEIVPGEGEISIQLRPGTNADVVTLVCVAGGAPFTSVEFDRGLGEFSFQTKLSGRRLDGKTSLGLSLAHAIFSLHAGILEPANDCKGSTGFKVTLPVLS